MSDKFETAALYAIHFQRQCVFFLLAIKEIGAAVVYKITRAALMTSNYWSCCAHRDTRNGKIRIFSANVGAASLEKLNVECTVEGSKQGQKGRITGSQFTFSSDLLSLNYWALSHAAKQLSLPDIMALMRELLLISAVLRNTRSGVRELINPPRGLETCSDADFPIRHLQRCWGKSRNSFSSNRLLGAGTFLFNEDLTALYLYKVKALLCLFIYLRVGPRRPRCRQGPFGLLLWKYWREARKQKKYINITHLPPFHFIIFFCLKLPFQMKGSF